MRLRAGDRVLVRLPGWLGDAVMAEPAVSALAERVGAANLTLAGPEPLVGLLADQLPGVRVAGPRPDAAWTGHDAAVLLTGSFRSALDALRAGIGVRAGWARDGRGWLLTHGARPPVERGRTPVGLGRPGRWPRILPRPFGAACAELVAWLGVPVHRTRPRLVVAERGRERMERRAAEASWDLGLGYVLLNVGARPGSAKGYPAWDRFASELASAGRRLVVAAGPGEEERLESIRQALGGPGQAPGRASGRASDRALLLERPVADLRELTAWIAGADLVALADGGPRHLAVALNRSLLVVAGPTDPRHTADHLGRTRLERLEVPCGPCHLERCPETGDAHHRCMLGLDPLDLARGALDMLAARNATMPG